MKYSNTLKPNSRGFTIVELLIVIVVIGILAAISIVAYSGIQNRANDSAVKSDLSAIAKIFMLQHADTGSFPQNNTDLGAIKDGGKYSIRPMKSAYKNVNNLLICWNNGTAFAIVAVSKSDTAFLVTNSSTSPTVFTGYTGASATTCSATGTASTGGSWSYTNNTWAYWTS